MHTAPTPHAKMLVLLAVALICQFSAHAQRQVIPSPDSPYRNFVGDWSGTIIVNPSKDPPNVSLTISEEPDEARMRWEYVFGTKGQKKYATATKFVVLSIAASKMLMHFTTEPVTIYGTSGLETFARDGYGRFSATTAFDNYNYFHIKSHVVSKVTFQLQPDRLVYVWEITEHQRTRLYSRFEFTRSRPAPTAGSQRNAQH